MHDILDNGGRLPKKNGPDTTAQNGGVSFIRLSDLAAIVGQVLDMRFSQTSYWVLAEVSGHQYKSQKNYHSFELIEKKEDSDGLMAKFSAKAWGVGASKIQEFEQKTGQRFTSNIQVLVKVKVVYHQQYGLALDLMDLDAAYTVGKLYEARHLTLLKLVTENDFIEKTSEGYWSKNKSMPLPVVIQRLAIISSLTSAGMEDFIHTLEKNPEGYTFKIDKYLTVVQGVDNADQVVDQLVQIFKSSKSYDVVLLLRGGGAQTDFILFDHYSLARAIAKFPIPIITGIGHQKNETLADLMAHTATKTPTQAAEFILHNNRLFERTLLEFRQDIVLKSQVITSFAGRQLIQLNSKIINRTTEYLQRQERLLFKCQSNFTRSVTTITHNRSQLLQQRKLNIFNAARSILNSQNQQLTRQQEKIRSWPNLIFKNEQNKIKFLQNSISLMSPERILQKGFALLKVDGKIVTDSSKLQIGQLIEIKTSQVSLKAIVQQKNENQDGTEFNL